MQKYGIGTFPYIVNYGDTVWGIVKRYNITIDALLRVNSHCNLENLYIGQQINIPINGSFFINDSHLIRLNNEILDINNLMRQYFWKYSIYFHNAILCIICNVANLDLIQEQMRINNLQFEKVLNNFYPHQKSQDIIKIIDNMQVISIEMIKARKVGLDINYLQKKWKENIESLKEGFIGLNAKWQEVDWEKKWNMYLEDLCSISDSYMHSNYQDVYLGLEKSFNDANSFANEITNGIIKQFPKRFKKEKS